VTTGLAWRDDYDAYVADWAGVPARTRNAFTRWWHRAFGLRPDPWYPPFAVAAALPEPTLRRIRCIGTRGARAIRERAARRELAA
jgi:hypothetical protein